MAFGSRFCCLGLDPKTPIGMRITTFSSKKYLNSEHSDWWVGGKKIRIFKIQLKRENV